MLGEKGVRGAGGEYAQREQDERGEDDRDQGSVSGAEGEAGQRQARDQGEPRDHGCGEDPPEGVGKNGLGAVELPGLGTAGGRRNRQAEEGWAKSAA